VVLAPTRELAQQIHEVTTVMTSLTNTRSCCIYGGVSKDQQIRDLETSEIIIATPGRLIDLVEDMYTHLKNTTVFVLDEADRMLDMGFEMQLNTIISWLVKPRQTLMFSATWPLDIQRITEKHFQNPIRITIGGENLAGAKKIVQIVEVCNPYEKKKRLRQLLNTLFKDNCKILIFMLYKKTCESFSNELYREGWPVVSLHGDKRQELRNAALEDFKSGKTPILVATDVAARGLDIKGVKYVINVEFPLRCEDYVHRIGRTGRAGEVGHAYTLFTADDKVHARELVQILQQNDQKISPELRGIADKAPGIKPKKTVLQEMYGDFAVKDPERLKMKSTRTVFED